MRKGRFGHIVVSAGMLAGMLDALDAQERRVLLAHERAHLAGRHHWWPPPGRVLLVGMVLAAVVASPAGVIDAGFDVDDIYDHAVDSAAPDAGAALLDAAVPAVSPAGSNLQPCRT